MKARLTVCSLINQQTKNISVIQTVVHRSCYLLLVLLTLARITLEKLSEVYAEALSPIPGKQQDFTAQCRYIKNISCSGNFVAATDCNIK